jgi:hypothetical protein
MYGSAPADMYTAAFGTFGQNIWVIPSLGIVVTRSSGTLTTASSRTDISDPEGPGLGTPGQIEYEFFRILMQAVQDPPQAPAPAYSTPAVGAFDTGLFVNPEDNLHVLGVGPTTPPGCTLLGCEDQIPGGQAIPALMAGAPAYSSAGTRLPGGFQALAGQIPDLLPRLLDGWSQTAALMAQQAPRTAPNLVETTRQSAEASQDTTARNLSHGLKR